MGEQTQPVSTGWANCNDVCTDRADCTNCTGCADCRVFATLGRSHCYKKSLNLGAGTWVLAIFRYRDSTNSSDWICPTDALRPPSEAARPGTELRALKEDAAVTLAKKRHTARIGAVVIIDG